MHPLLKKTNQNNHKKKPHNANIQEVTFHIKIHLKSPSNMKKGRHSTEQYEKKIQIWKRGKKKGR